MKKSILLKAICYLLIPILLLAIVLSICSIIIQNEDSFDEKRYYSSSYFVRTYMNDISNACKNLIYHNANYYSLEDGDTTIYFTNLEEDYYYSNVKEWNYLIIYKNKALTNVELNDSTKTIDGIKQYLNEKQNAKKVNLINGEFQSDNEMMQKTGIQYLDSLKNEYYTIMSSEEETEDVEISTDREYITTKYSDFEIYSIYTEGFKENSEEAILLNILNAVSIITDNSYVIIPICSVLTLLMVIYLIFFIGSDKKLNDFDQIPLEIIIGISIFIAIFPMIVREGFLNLDFSVDISFLFTSYLLTYIVGMVCLTTLIRRLKAKGFWKTTIVGKIYFWLEKKWKKITSTLTYSTNMTIKVLIYGVAIGILAFCILLIFDFTFIAIVLEFIVWANVLYKIIKFLKDYSKIENRLKEMKEGNNQVALDVNEFSSELKNTVLYINQISEGVENAIQDRMKSERLKAELITNVSHDIKTPLTSIINYVDLLKNEPIENEKAKEYIGILESKSQRLKNLTEDLIEASKVSTGNIAFQIEKINLVELVRQAAGEFEDRFLKKGLNTILDTTENEIDIMADSKYMYRIIENLFSNVAKYALENSRVYIDLKKVDKKVKVEIKNISKDKLNISSDELMQRFVRGDKSRTTEGSGLGLSIAQNLTELQHGKFNLVLDGDLFKVELEFELA